VIGQRTKIEDETMDNLISIKSLTKSYTRGKQKVEVLHGLTLDIPSGDFVALMGRRARARPPAQSDRRAGPAHRW
jgi:ABC-type bacteriocin/lantibiotic exporter with double-glycine peptidase domain